MNTLQYWIDFHPFIRFSVLLALIILGHRIFARWGKSLACLSFFLSIGAAMALAVTLWQMWPYFTSPACGWPLEPQIVSVSEMVRRGGPAYPQADLTGLCYQQVYGPATYLTYAAVFQLFSRSIEAAKAASALAALAAMMLMASLIWRSQHRHRFVLLGLLAAVFAYFGIYAWGIRPDPWILLSLSVFLIALAFPRGILPIIVASLAGGWLLAYKPSSALYLMAPLIWAWQNRGWRWAWSCGALMIPAALWPFLLPQFSVTGYLFSLREESNFPFLARTLSGPIQTILMLTVLVITGLDKDKKTWLIMGFYLVGLAGTLLATGRLLAVNHHFMPYFLVGLFLVSRTKKEQMIRASHPGMGRTEILKSDVPMALALALTLSALWATYTRKARNAYEAEAQLSRQVIADLDNIIAAHPDRRISMALGAGLADGPGSLTPYRSHLVLRGQPYFLDVETLMEIGFQGIDPNFVFKQMAEANKDILWLTPKGQAPFAAISSYTGKTILNSSAAHLTGIKVESSHESPHFDLIRIHP